MEPTQQRQVVELKARSEEAGRRWLTLYREPDCLGNPSKRSAMLEARIDYQDALVEFLFLLRTGEPPQK